MKIQLFTTMFMSILTWSSLLGQQFRVKGLLLPLVHQTAGFELKLSKPFSSQIMYARSAKLQDNRYVYQRLTPSFRYNHFTEKKLLNNSYVEAFFRKSFIKYYPDQATITLIEYTNSALGMSVGKLLFLSSKKKLFFDLSLGRYFIFANSYKNPSQTEIFYPEEIKKEGRWRISITFGFQWSRKKQHPANSENADQ